MFGSSFKKEKTTTIAITKYPAAIGDLSLSTALQYSDAVAFPQLEKFMYEFVTKVFQPAYLDYTTMVHTGNTDGLVYPISARKRRFDIFCQMEPRRCDFV